MARYFLGVDGGTESLRAAVFDTAGNIVGTSALAYETQYPHPGWAEQRPEDWWAALGHAVRGAVSAAGIEPQQVEALCLDTTCCTVVALDQGAHAATRCMCAKMMQVVDTLHSAGCMCARTYMGCGMHAASHPPTVTPNLPAAQRLRLNVTCSGSMHAVAGERFTGACALACMQTGMPCGPRCCGWTCARRNRQLALQRRATPRYRWRPVHARGVA